jgi:alpha-galactosidase
MAKIVMIGGGSYNWTAHLVRDMVVKPELAGSELWLVDINKKALKDLEAYCKALLQHAKSDFTLHTTTNRDEALPKADFVVITISTGGLEAMRPDLEIPYKYGIFQPVGDTVGPGGISRALRNIPVFMDFAKSIKKYCPNAWVLNITNPMTVLTQVLCQQGCKTVGLCHELYSLWGLLRDQLKCQWDEVSLQVAGLNHFGFILSARHKNYDAFKVFQKMASDSKTRMAKANVNLTHAETHGHHVFKFEYFRRTGMMLYPGDRHTSEFFSNVLTKDTGYGAAYHIRLTKIKDRYTWLNAAKKRVKAMTEKPSTIDLTPSREAMSSLLVSLMTGKPLVEVVNLPNVGQIENLPRGVAVETMATVTADKIVPHTVGTIPDELAMLLNHHAIRFNLVIQAALTGDRKLALQAMASDPLVREWNKAGEMLDKLLKANKKYLPQF